MTQQTKKSGEPHGCSRRQLLVGLGASGVTALLAGCGMAGTAPPPPAIPILPTRQPALPSPQAQSSESLAQAPPLPGGLSLASFLSLSSLLTGIDDLDPQVGVVYLESLAGSDQFGVSLAELYEQIGFGEGGALPSLEEAAASGVFAEEATRTLADKVIEYWYSGVYDTADGEQAVATFADALVWQAVGYTKPLSLCGAPGFWALAPADPVQEG